MQKHSLASYTILVYNKYKKLIAKWTKAFGEGNVLLKTKVKKMVTSSN